MDPSKGNNFKKKFYFKNQNKKNNKRKDYRDPSLYEKCKDFLYQVVKSPCLLQEKLENREFHLIHSLFNHPFFLEKVIQVRSLLKILMSSQKNLNEEKYKHLLEIVYKTNFLKKGLILFYGDLDLPSSYNLENIQLMEFSVSLWSDLFQDFAMEEPSIKSCLKIFITNYLDHISQFNSDTNNQFNYIQTKYNELRIINQTEEINKIYNEPYSEPPEDFRTLSIFPHLTRDLQPGHVPYLRKLRINCPYQNNEEYLDIQFRLFKEDFIEPLRESLNKYKFSNQTTKEIKIYSNNYFLDFIITNKGVFYLLKFNFKHMEKIDWGYSNKFLYGSIVCLSMDNFKSMFVATLIDRNIHLLKKNILILKIEKSDETDVKICFDQPYQMIETQAFFESYRHVLKALQNMNQIPFSKYFLKNGKEPRFPLYLRLSSYVIFNLSCITNSSFLEVDVKQDFSHILNKTNLDKFQLESIQKSLQQDVSVIQGPPGTGKSFVGLKIVQIFLENWKIWNRCSEGQILVVTYTNHALDSFLKEMLRFTTDMVRVGSGSKEQSLESFNLSQVKKDLSKSKSFPHSIFAKKHILKRNLDEMEDKISQLKEYLKYSEKNILNYENLKKFMTKDHNYCFEKILSNDKMNYFLLDNWALDDYKEKEEDFYGEKEKEVYEGKEEYVYEEKEEDTNRHPNPLQVFTTPFIFNSHENEEKEEDYITKKMNELKLEEDRDNKFYEKCIEVLSKKSAENSNFKIIENKKNKRRKIILKIPPMDKNDILKIKNIFTLNSKKRAMLYKYWLILWRKELEENFQKEKIKYDEIAQELIEHNKNLDLEVFKKKKIIGMTTTGAARYREILNKLQPKIIIIEEAAEILEVHTIVNINLDCQHLILIGDHQQLRPKINSYYLRKGYHFDISLFERLVKNNYPFVTLVEQHRMRPLISQFAKIIYPNLKDHSSVLTYDKINGINTNVYFFNHSYPENQDVNSTSYYNHDEALFVTNLCFFFLQQNYKPDQITILCTYIGQLRKIKMLSKNKFSEVRITTVDDYQGEENDIIIISLVRSNENKEIGFLKEDNRVCVALTRAKKGMFVFGNFSCLQKSSSIWEKIINKSKDFNPPLIGNEFSFYCQKHPEKKFSIFNSLDFNQMPNGGCTIPCLKELPCGHHCTLKCHSYDLDHLAFQCMERCTKLCPKNHQCSLKCHQICKPCDVIKSERVPSCGHIQNMKCSIDPIDFICQEFCPNVLSCGHQCQEVCGKDHTIFCAHLVEVTLKCNHKKKVKCYLSKNPEKIICDKKCTSILKCSHLCAGTCGLCFQNLFHMPCAQKCQKILSCGHKCFEKCSVECFCRCKINFPQRVCGLDYGNLCKLCSESCPISCVHFKCDMKKYEPCNKPRCFESCPEILSCNHRCVGSCGDQCPPCLICRREDFEKLFVGKNLVVSKKFIVLSCHHIFEVDFLDQEINSQVNQNKLNPFCPKCQAPIQNIKRYFNEIKVNISSKSTCDDFLFKVCHHNFDLTFPDLMHEKKFLKNKMILKNVSKNFLDIKKKNGNILTYIKSLKMILKIFKNKNKIKKTLGDLDNPILRITSSFNLTNQQVDELEKIFLLPSDEFLNET